MTWFMVSFHVFVGHMLFKIGMAIIISVWSSKSLREYYLHYIATEVAKSWPSSSPQRKIFLFPSFASSQRLLSFLFMIHRYQTFHFLFSALWNIRFFISFSVFSFPTSSYSTVSTPYYKGEINRDPVILSSTIFKERSTMHASLAEGPTCWTLYGGYKNLQTKMVKK